MAFMMPVVKNDWDIYHSQRTRRISESASESRGGRARKISESRSEGPPASPRAAPGAGLGSPHRSAPTMRSLSYCRAPPSRASRASLPPSQPDSPGPGRTASGSPPQSARPSHDKFHNRTQSLRCRERPGSYLPTPTTPTECSRGEHSLRRRLALPPTTSSPAHRYCIIGCVPHFEFRRRTSATFLS